MKVFNCILGIFAMLGGFYCILFPGATFLSSGIILSILLGVMGLCSVFEYFVNRKQKDGKEGKSLMTNGVMGLIFGIGAAVFSLAAMYDPSLRAMLDMIILMVFVCWLVYSGVSGIFRAVFMKKQGSKMWVFSLVLSILVILTGLFATSHLLYTALTIGYLIGIGLNMYGIRLILSVFESEE